MTTLCTLQDALAERMERYAKASGHPRLVELLSRHAKDQKDKFTLSDDENQVGYADIICIAFFVTGVCVHRVSYITYHHHSHTFKHTEIFVLRSPCAQGASFARSMIVPATINVFDPRPRPLLKNKVSNADDDADYMENFDHKDGDAIFRSPIGSLSGSLDGNNVSMSPSSP